MFKEAFKYTNETFKDKFMSFFLILLPLALVSSLIQSFNLPDTSSIDITQAPSSSPGEELGKYPILGILNQLFLQGLMLSYIAIKVIDDSHSKGKLKNISDYYYGSILFIFRLFVLSLLLLLIGLLGVGPGAILVVIGQAINIELISNIGGVIAIIGVLFVVLKTVFSYYYLICENKSFSDSILASYYSIPNQKLAYLFGVFLLLSIFIIILAILGSFILGLALSPFMGISMGAYLFAITFVFTLLAMTVINVYLFLFIYHLYLHFKGDVSGSLNADS